MWNWSGAGVLGCSTYRRNGSHLLQHPQTSPEKRTEPVHKPTDFPFSKQPTPVIPRRSSHKGSKGKTGSLREMVSTVLDSPQKPPSAQPYCCQVTMPCLSPYKASRTHQHRGQWGLFLFLRMSQHSPEAPGHRGTKTS